MNRAVVSARPSAGCRGIILSARRKPRDTPRIRPVPAETGSEQAAACVGSIAFAIGFRAGRGMGEQVDDRPDLRHVMDMHAEVASRSDGIFMI